MIVALVFSLTIFFFFFFFFFFFGGGGEAGGGGLGCQGLNDMSLTWPAVFHLLFLQKRLPHVSFCNLTSEKGHKKVTSTIPAYFKNQSPPIISYSYISHCT